MNAEPTDDTHGATPRAARPDAVLTITMAARRYRVPEHTLRRQIQRGALPVEIMRVADLPPDLLRDLPARVRAGVLARDHIQVIRTMTIERYVVTRRRGPRRTDDRWDQGATPTPDPPIYPTEAPTMTQILHRPLTRREAEILALIAQGYTNHEIAATLAVAGSTVENHIRRIYCKLPAVNRADLIRLARRQAAPPPFPEETPP